LEQSRYAQAITVLESTLKKGWTALFDDSVESITLSSKFSTESVELALRLCECYESDQVLDQAEQIYFRLYRAHHKAHGINNAIVTRHSDLYLAFLKRHGLYDRIITFYQELLVSYRNIYGYNDKKTITLLYTLADTCRTHQLVHRYWVEYYLEIVNAVNKGDLVSQKDALRALVIVAEHYYESRRFTEALVHFKSIATTCKSFGAARSMPASCPALDLDHSDREC
jgi:tetratricopeptide (TPR) repeat protein